MKKYLRVVGMLTSVIKISGFVKDNSVFYYDDRFFDENGVNVLYHGSVVNKIYDETPTQTKNKDKIVPFLVGNEHEMLNFLHFSTKNKLSFFINMSINIGQAPNSMKFTPYFVEKEYSDEEIYKILGFTSEEIDLIECTIKKFNRKSAWFKRYMCGKC